MTSKTFECMNPVVELIITKGSNGNINFIINHELRGSTKATLEKSAGADAALAILEVAGVEPSSPHYGLNDSPEWNLRWASHYLGQSIELTNAHAAEAEAQAELEAEALELCNEYVRSADAKPYDSWEEIVRVSKRMAENWLAVARKAREMRAEK